MNLASTAMTVCLLAIGLGTPADAAWTWERLEYPGASVTYANGIWKNKIVGVYGGGGQGGGFVYDGTTWTALSFPGSYMTSALGVWDNTIVGYYSMPGWEFEAGFLCDGQTWQTLAYPGAMRTRAQGVYENRVVGYYVDANFREHGFLYDGTTYQSLDYPDLWNARTVAKAIWGDTIVGQYAPWMAGPGRGFAYNGSTWATLHPTEASTSYVNGICEAGMVGGTQLTPSAAPQAFLLNGTTWTWLDYPGAAFTRANGMSGNRIVGTYRDTLGGESQSFILTIPEPTSLALLALAALLTLRRRRT